MRTLYIIKLGHLLWEISLPWLYLLPGCWVQLDHGDSSSPSKLSPAMLHEHLMWHPREMNAWKNERERKTVFFENTHQVMHYGFKKSLRSSYWLRSAKLLPENLRIQVGFVAIKKCNKQNLKRSNEVFKYSEALSTSSENFMRSWAQNRDAKHLSSSNTAPSAVLVLESKRTLQRQQAAGLQEGK